MREKILNIIDELIEKQKCETCPLDASDTCDFVREIFRKRFESPGLHAELFLTTPMQAVMKKFPLICKNENYHVQLTKLFDLGDMKIFLEEIFGKAEMMESIDHTLDYLKNKDIAIFNINMASPTEIGHQNTSQ